MTEKSERLYNILVAFQHFAGKPLRSVDHAEKLTEEELTTMEDTLRKLATSFRGEDRTKSPELHHLANLIEQHLPLEEHRSSVTV